MPRSDLPIASDTMMRELVRQLADAAPAAPGFDDLGARVPGEPAGAPRPHWGQLALVAAVTALIVSGIWWLQRPSADPAIPAETTTVPVPTVAESTTTVAEDPAGAWAQFVATAAPAEVQLCLTRVSSNLAAAGDLPDLAVQPDLAGDFPGVQELGRQRDDVGIIAVLAGAPVLDPATRSRLGEVAEAYAVAEDGQFADEGRPAADFADLVAAFAAVRGEVLSPDPAGCPLEAVAAPLIDDAPDDLAAVRCVASARLDHAIATFSDGVTEASLVDRGTTALTAWYQQPPDDLIDLVAQMRDALLLPPDLAADELSVLRSEVARLAGTDCRLLESGQPAEEATP